MKKSFILFHDSLDVIDVITDEQGGKLLKKMRSYNTNGDYESGDPLVDAVFVQFKNQFDRSNEKYEEKCQKNKENGKKGGRPKKKPNGLSENPKEPNGLSENPSKAKKADKDKDKDKDNKTDNKITIYTPTGEFDYSFVDLFVDSQREYHQVENQIEKDGLKKYLGKQKKQIDMLIKDGYTLEQIQYILAFILKDDFWKDKIMTVKKLRDKNKDGNPYIVVLIDRIKSTANEKQKDDPNGRYNEQGFIEL